MREHSSLSTPTPHSFQPRGNRPGRAIATGVLDRPDTDKRKRIVDETGIAQGQSSGSGQAQAGAPILQHARALLEHRRVQSGAMRSDDGAQDIHDVAEASAGALAAVPEPSDLGASGLGAAG